MRRVQCGQKTRKNKPKNQPTAYPCSLRLRVYSMSKSTIPRNNLRFKVDREIGCSATKSTNQVISATSRSACGTSSSINHKSGSNPLRRFRYSSKFCCLSDTCGHITCHVDGPSRLGIFSKSRGSLPFSRQIIRIAPEILSPFRITAPNPPS